MRQASNIRTATAADRFALRRDLKEVRSMVSMVEGDQDPSFGGPRVQHFSRDLVYLREALALINTILSGTNAP